MCIDDVSYVTYTWIYAERKRTLHSSSREEKIREILLIAVFFQIFEKI